MLFIFSSTWSLLLFSFLYSQKQGCLWYWLHRLSQHLNSVTIYSRGSKKRGREASSGVWMSCHLTLNQRNSIFNFQPVLYIRRLPMILLGKKLFCLAKRWKKWFGPITTPLPQPPFHSWELWSLEDSELAKLMHEQVSYKAHMGNQAPGLPEQCAFPCPMKPIKDVINSLLPCWS